MGGCNCLERKKEEENEIKNADDDVKNKSDPEIENPFNPEEYENVLLTEKKEAEEEITNLESEKNDHYNKFNISTLELINQVRKDPKSYANKIIDSKQYIINENSKKVFKKKVKVLLNRGEAAFQEAADALTNMSPMGELTMKQEIVIPLPENEDEMNDNNLLRDKVAKIRENHNINRFLKETQC